MTTTRHVKERARIDLQALLKGNILQFCEPFVSSRADARDEICKQLKAYRYEVKIPKDPSQSYKWTLTGKSSGMNDDLCIALNLAVFWSAFYMSDPKAFVIPL